MESKNQAEVININNYYQQENSYMSAVIALAQWSKSSITLFGPSEEVLYFNNRLGLLDASVARDCRTLTSMTTYIDRMSVEAWVVYDAAKQCYKDLKPTSVKVSIIDGRKIDFDIFPCLESMSSGYQMLKCVVVIGTVKNQDLITK